MSRIPLPRVPRALLDRKLVKKPVSSKRLYTAVVEGRVPAEQDDNGRWSVDEPDLPLIAEALSSTAMAA
jgi:hypothetical protein